MTNKVIVYIKSFSKKTNNQKTTKSCNLLLLSLIKTASKKKIIWNFSFTLPSEQHVVSLYFDYSVLHSVEF